MITKQKNIVLIASCIAYLASFPLHAAGLGKQAIMQHVNMLQELKNVFVKKQKKKKPVTSSMTVSEAHMSLYNSTIHAKFGYYLNQPYYKNIIDTALACEREYNDTHYVLYHGQRFALRVIQDVMSEIYQLLNLHSVLDEFAFMRLWYAVEKHKDLNAFIDSYEGYQLGNKIWNDEEAYLVSKMMSTNICFFGNVTYGGECTFGYFVDGIGWHAPDLSSFLAVIWNKFNFNSVHIKKIAQLAAKVNAAGSLVQIFIPKDKMDQCAYLCRDWGTPLRYPIVNNIYDQKRNRHTLITPILEAIKSNPTAINNHLKNYIHPKYGTPYSLDWLQARLVITDEFLANPDSDIIIFRYAPVETKALEIYRQELKNIMQEVFIEWIEQRLKQGNRKGYPIDNLMFYILQNPENKKFNTLSLSAMIRQLFAS